MPKILVKQPITKIVKVGSGGPPGPVGPGFPAGGNVGQIPRKVAGDFNSEWSDSAPDTDAVSGVAAATVISRIGAVEVGQGANVIGFVDKATMDADLAHDDGTVAYVTNDATAGNNGTWRKSGASGSGIWVQSSFDRVALVEARETFTEGLTKGQLSSYDAVNTVPSTWMDGLIITTEVKEAKNGISALKISATRGLKCPVSALNSNSFDLSIILAGRTAGGATPRLLVRQLISTLGEISASRRTYNLTAEDGITKPIIISFEGVPLDENCAYVEFYLDSGSTDLWWAFPYLGDASGNAGWRPTFNAVDVEETIALTVENEAKTNKLSGVVGLNNLVTDPFFNQVGIGLLWGSAFGKTQEFSVVNGFQYLKITNQTVFYRVDKNAISGDIISAAISVESSTVGSNARVLIMQYDDDAEISASRATLSIDPTVDGGKADLVSEGIVIDPTCVSIRFFLDSPAGTTVFGKPTLMEGTTVLFAPHTAPREIYVANSGDDANGTGAIYNPYQTINRAVNAVNKHSSTIILRGGDYIDQEFRLHYAQGLKIRNYPTERVRFLYGSQVAGVVKTGGYTQVYEGTLSAAPGGQFVFEHETPEGLIPANERMSLQRGREYRLPSTRLFKVNSIAEVDAATRPSWFWVGGVLYFTAADFGDATSHAYYSPAGSSGNVQTVDTSGANAPNIEIEGIESWYAWQGFSFIGAASYKITDCFAFGSVNQGIGGNRSRGTEIRCELAACGNDGSNAHNETTEAYDTFRDSSYLKIDTWSHDNYDDGDSLHERCQGTYIGGLYEYNGDRGIATAYGAHVTAHNIVTRKNGQNTRGDAGSGEGFGVVGVNAVEEGGVGTQMECYNCVSIEDNYGFAAQASDGTVRAHNCRTIAALVGAYAASSGEVYLFDCSDSGSSTVKLESNGGTVNVSNGTLVV